MDSSYFSVYFNKLILNLKSHSVDPIYFWSRKWEWDSYGERWEWESTLTSSFSTLFNLI